MNPRVPCVASNCQASQNCPSISRATLSDVYGCCAFEMVSFWDYPLWKIYCRFIIIFIAGRQQFDFVPRRISLEPFYLASYQLFLNDWGVVHRAINFFCPSLPVCHAAKLNPFFIHQLIYAWFGFHFQDSNLQKYHFLKMNSASKLFLYTIESFPINKTC